MKTVTVSASKTYEIKIGSGLLKTLGQEARALGKAAKICVVSETTVFPLYGEIAVTSLKNAGFDVISYVFPAGEESKNGSVFLDLVNFLAENKLTRTDMLVALGGGVVGDLAGFAAACFMRGIDFYNIPTTILSQVDSSVGGKVAIDLDQIKNCVGAFHQPKAVLIDPQVLNTLPQRQIANGLAEAVKMAVNFDESLLSLLEQEDALSQIDQIIAASLKIKAAVVKADEKEAGLRRVLNFGHTIGHGIETATGLYHGECVALGMLPMCSDALRPRVKAILEKLNLPTTCTADPEAVWQAMSHDKKLSGDTITVVYAEKAGSFQLQSIPMEDLKERVYEFLGGKG